MSLNYNRSIKSFTLYLTKRHRFTGLNAQHSDWKEIECKSYLIFRIIFAKDFFFNHYTNVSTQSFTKDMVSSPTNFISASLWVTLRLSLYVTLSASLCLFCLLSVGCAGVFIPPALHMVKISEGNQEPSRSGLGPWHCPGLGAGRCLSGASLWGLSALKNLFVYPRVRSGLRSWALLLSAHQGPGLLPLATDKNCC